MAWDVRHEGYFDVGQPPPRPNRRFPLMDKSKTPLSVTTKVRFPDLKIDYSRTYEATRELPVTDELFECLLYRLEHSSEELITRRDSGALQSYGSRSPKVLKYEIHFEIDGMSQPKKEKVFRSFQKQATTMDQAREVILATDRMVGPFLKRHDGGFRWVDGPVREHFTTRPETSRPSIGGTQSLLCVPRCRFIEATQDYEFVPGYEILVFLQSSNTARQQRLVSKSIRVSSRECSPLNLELGEDLLRRASNALDGIFDSRRNSLLPRDRGGENHSLTMELRVKNNLGPDYDHLCHTIHSKQALFRARDGSDCGGFLENVQLALSRVASDMDRNVAKLNELEINVSQLSGSDWQMAEPFTIYLDNTVYYSHRSMEAVMDRVQAGIADILHGHSARISLSAQYRGHLILDKTLVAHEDPEVLALSPSVLPDEERANTISMLKQRIWADIVAVCKDTCKLREPTDYLPNLHLSPDDGLLHQRADETGALGDTFVTPKNRRFFPAHLSHGSAESNLTSFASASVGQSQVFSRGDRADDVDDSTPPSTPSLVDGESETPRDSLLVTPPSETKSSPGGNEPESAIGGLHIADDDVNATVVREFAYLDEAAEEKSKGFDAESERRPAHPQATHSHSILDTPTPVRNLVKLPAHPEFPPSPSKAPFALCGEEVATPTLEAHATSDEETPRAEPVMEPILEGILEYGCELVDSETEDDAPAEKLQLEEAVLETLEENARLVVIETVVEGVLETAGENNQTEPEDCKTQNAAEAEIGMEKETTGEGSPSFETENSTAGGMTTEEELANSQEVDNKPPDISASVAMPEQMVDCATAHTLSKSWPVPEPVEAHHSTDDCLPEPPSAETEDPFESVGAVEMDYSTSNKDEILYVSVPLQYPFHAEEQAPMEDGSAVEEVLLGDPILPVSPTKETRAVDDEQPTSVPTSRRLSSTALMPRPTSLLPAFRPFSSPFFPATESVSSSPILRPRSAIPFGGRPSHLRHHSMSTANYLGLHEEQLFSAPLQDALFGFHSRPQSSRNSPALRPITAHAMLPPPIPAPDDTNTYWSASGSIAADEKEGMSKKKDRGLKRILRRQKTEEVKDSGGVNAIPGMMIFAAGVTIASSMFHRG